MTAVSTQATVRLGRLFLCRAISQGRLPASDTGVAQAQVPVIWVKTACCDTRRRSLSFQHLKHVLTLAVQIDKGLDRGSNHLH